MSTPTASSGSSEWYKDNYLVSTSHTLLQPDVINKEFGSDDMYWVEAVPEDALKDMLSNSVCFGVYALPQTSSQVAGRATPTQIGFARLITDKVTFAYITDVFLISEFRSKGLGKWLMQCVNQHLETWPLLRCAMLYAGGETAERFYKGVLGMKTFRSGFMGLNIMTKRGPGDILPEDGEE